MFSFCVTTTSLTRVPDTDALGADIPVACVYLTTSVAVTVTLLAAPGVVPLCDVVTVPLVVLTLNASDASLFAFSAYVREYDADPPNDGEPELSVVVDPELNVYVATPVPCGDDVVPPAVIFEYFTCATPLDGFGSTFIT